MNWLKKGILFTLFTSALIILTCFEAKTQNLRKIEKQAIQSFDSENFVKARDLFLILRDSAWNFNRTSSYLASCYLELDEPLKSYEVISKVTDPDQLNLYMKILASYALEHFEEANQIIKNFRDTVYFDIKSISNTLSRAKIYYNDGQGILIQNFGNTINSKDMEYCAVMYNDFNKLLFTARKENSSVTDVDGLAFETVYSTQLDSADNWQEPTPLNIEDVEKRSHDATVQVYESGNKMISFHDGRLYSSTLKDGIWSRDEYLDLHEKGGSDTHCFITSDEKTIFFASDYLSKGQDLDLFVSRKDVNGNWSTPEPLTVFNTEFDEDSPFLANDSTFYFSSRGHDSMGGHDIFKSTYDPVKKQWGAPENLGFPINTVAEDIYYNTNGKLAYLSSNRLGGYGSMDLYRVYLFNKVKVQGKLLTDDQQPIGNAEIDVKYDSTTLKSYTDEDGNYELFVPIHKNMHITFIKDSLNQFEGDYIANIFFKDENNNEFNFFIDYMNTEPEKKGNKDSRIVSHLNIDVKNDFEDNPIIASVSEKSEKTWSDSTNFVAEKRQKLELENREISKLSRRNGENVDITSSHLRIRDATIHESIKKQSIVDGIETIEATAFKKAKTGKYTVQILAMSKLKPDNKYFQKLDKSAIDNRNGKDGLKRFFMGEYASKEDALKAMRSLREKGYSDAFIRRLDKYLEL